MVTSVSCPKCGKSYKLDAANAKNRELQCGSCGQSFTAFSSSDTIQLKKQNSEKATLLKKSGSPDEAMSDTANDTVVAGQQKVKSTPPDTEGKTIVSPPPPRAKDSRRVNKRGIIGREIGGCKIISKLGEGGMGAVFKAHHQALDIPVAIKILPPSFAKTNKLAAERFVREARAAARLQHQNIVGVLNVGQQDNLHFIVMQYVEGESLQQLLEREKVLSAKRASEILMQACDGLQVASDNGIVHRDIKPDNIMIDKKGVVKIADLGLAKSMDEDTQMTQSGVAMGTPHYMAPEQADDARGADHRADIYSLGCTLFRMVCGKVPFDGSSAFTILTKHVNEEAPDPRFLNPGLPESICQILTRTMAKNPDERYQSANKLRAALQKSILGQSVTKVQKKDSPPKAAAALSAKTSQGKKTLSAKALRKQATGTVKVQPVKPPAQKKSGTLPIVLGAGTIALILVYSLWPATKKPEIKKAKKQKSSKTIKKIITTKPQAKPKQIFKPDQWRKSFAKANAALAENLFKTAQLYYREVLESVKQDKTTSATIIKGAIQSAQEGRDLAKFIIDRKTLPVALKIKVTQDKLKELNPKYDGSGHFGKENNNIVRVELAKSGIEDIRPLRGLPLQEVNLDNLNLGDLSILSKMPIERLSCARSTVANLKFLKKMPLTSLDISFCQTISDLTPLKGMQLNELDCSGNKIENLSPLAGMPLEKLSCPENDIADFSPLKHLQLEAIIFDALTVEKGIEVLQKMKTLQNLGIDRKRIFPQAEFWRRYKMKNFNPDYFMGDANSDRQRERQEQKRQGDLQTAENNDRGRNDRSDSFRDADKYLEQGNKQEDEDVFPEIKKSRQSEPLQMVDYFQDEDSILDGMWDEKQGIFYSDDFEFAGVQFGYSPPNEYDFRVVFKMTKVKNGIALVLSRYRKEFVCLLGGNEGSIFGFPSKSRRRGAEANLGKAKNDLRLKAGKRYAATVQVRKNKAKIFINAEEIASIGSAISKLKAPPVFTNGTPGAVKIFTLGNSTLFYGAEIVEINGKGKEKKLERPRFNSDGKQPFDRDERHREGKNRRRRGNYEKNRGREDFDNRR